MGGSVSAGKSKAKNSNESSFQQNVWDPQSQALNNLYSQVGQLFGQTNSGMQGQIPGAVNNMQNINQQAMPAWQNQLQGGAYSGLGIGNQLMGSLNQSLNSPTNTQQVNSMIMGGSGNNYADAMKNQYIQDANLAQRNMLSNLDARASAAGMSGGSRHGIATAQGMQDINRNLQSNLAQTGYNTFDKDLDRKLQIAGQADQGTLQRQQMMQAMLGGQQQAMQGGLQYGQGMQNLGMGTFAPYMAPWQAAGAYSNAIGAPTVLSSGSGSGSGSSKGIGAGGSVLTRPPGSK